MLSLSKIPRFFAIILEWAIGILLAVIILLGYNIVDQQIKNTQPLDSIVTFAGLQVPDYEQGQESSVIVAHDRIVRKTFVGDVGVELKSSVTSDTICYSGGIVTFTKGSTAVRRTILDYMQDEKECVTSLPPGQYYLLESVKINVEGGTTRFVTFSSNPFKVYPPGKLTKQLSITTPESP